MESQVNEIDNRNLFVNDTDIASEDLARFTNEFISDKRSLTNICKEQTTLSIQIYSRSAKEGTAEKSHKGWTKELQELARKITECELKIRNKLEKVPHFDSNYAMIVHWVDLSKQQQTVYFLSKTNKELQHVTDSPVYKQAYELYKKVVTQCEFARKYLKVAPINELSELFTETSRSITEQKEAIEDLNPKLKKEIKSLHKDVLELMLYTLASYKDCDIYYETSPRQSLMQKIGNFKENLTENKEDLADRLRKIHIDDGEALSTESVDYIAESVDYIAEAEKITLTIDRYFEMGSYGVSWRYSKENYTVITLLQNKARCLQTIERDLYRLLETIWDNTYPDNKQVTISKENIKLLQDILRKITRDLKAAKKPDPSTSPFSDEIPPIFDYCTSLLAWARELRHALDFLNEITSDEWLQVHNIRNNLLGFLSLGYQWLERHPDSQWRRVQHLYAAASQLTILPKPAKPTTYAETLKIDTIERIRTTVSITSPKAHSITAPEMQLIELLYKDKQISNGVTIHLDYANTIKSLLSRQITECIYFTHEVCNPVADICHSLLTHTKSYRKIFSTLRKDPAFDQIVSAYETHTKSPQDEHLLKTYANVFQLLMQANSLIREIKEKPSNGSENKYEILLYYVVSQQHLSTLLTESSDPITAYRIKQLLPIATQKLKKIHMRYKFPDYYAQPPVIEDGKNSVMDESQIYACLLHVLYADKKDMQILKKLRAQLENTQVEIASEETQLLLDAFITTLFSHDIPLSLKEEQYLVEMFKQYLENGTKWRDFHGTIHMEEMLYKYLYKHSSQYNISKNFFPELCSPKRANPQYANSWKIVLSSYTEGKELLSKHKSPIKKDSERAQAYIKLLNTIGQEAQKFITNKEPFYFELFSHCYSDMKAHSEKFTK